MATGIAHKVAASMFLPVLLRIGLYFAECACTRFGAADHLLKLKAAVTGGFSAFASELHPMHHHLTLAPIMPG